MCVLWEINLKMWSAFRFASITLPYFSGNRIWHDNRNDVVSLLPIPVTNSEFFWRWNLSSWSRTPDKNWKLLTLWLLYISFLDIACLNVINQLHKPPNLEPQSVESKRFTKQSTLTLISESKTVIRFFLQSTVLKIFLHILQFGTNVIQN